MTDWSPIADAPLDNRDILVGGYVHDDEAGDLTWATAISSREDCGWRRSYRHWRGASWATHFMLLPEPPHPPQE